jgi:hypothetical protein
LIRTNIEVYLKLFSEVSSGVPPSPVPTDAQKLALESEDPMVLKQELQNAYERIRQQELDIKKLKFEVEMEQGHVNILRHDNQMLRRMTVDMVSGFTVP